MLNFHEFVRGFPNFRKIVADDLLFAEYHCIVEETKKGIWSDQNYFAFVVSGKKKWQSMRHEYILEGGQAIFVKKGANMVHQYFDDDFCAVMIFLPDEFIRKFLARHPALSVAPAAGERSSDPVIRIEVDDLMGSYFASVLSYFPQPVAPAPELMKLKFEELLYHVFARKPYAELASFMRSLGSDPNELFVRIMEDNFAYNLELEEFASLCAMSLSTFKRSFAGVYKETPGKWLLDKRLELSSHLLRTTERNVDQVAFDAGFESSSHYIRVFKEKYGSTPLQFRQQPA